MSVTHRGRVCGLALPDICDWTVRWNSSDADVHRQAIFGHYRAKGVLATTDWVVHADSDEFHGFPLSNEHPSIRSFLGSLNDVDVVAGVWRDRINSNGQLLPIEEDMDIFSSFPLACNFRTKQKIMAYRFGVPTTEGNRKVGTSVCLGKEDGWLVIQVDGRSGLIRFPQVAPEAVKKVKFYPEQLNVHHFKWVDGVIPRLERRVKVRAPPPPNFCSVCKHRMALHENACFCFVQVKSTQGRETAAENVEAILDHLYKHDRGICVNCPKVAAVRFRWIFCCERDAHDRAVLGCCSIQGCTACNGKLTTAEGCDAVHKSLYQEFVRSSLKGVHSLKEAFRKGVAYVPDDEISPPRASIRRSKANIYDIMARLLV